MTTATGTRQPRRTVSTFRIQFVIGADLYAVVPLATHPEVAAAAVRLIKKTGTGEQYDVSKSPEGHVGCECKGFLRHAHCKHVRACKAARML